MKTGASNGTSRYREAAVPTTGIGPTGENGRKTTRRTHAGSWLCSGGRTASATTAGCNSRRGMKWKSIIGTRTERTTGPKTWCSCTPIVTTLHTVDPTSGIYDRDPFAEEPDEAKGSRPVREWQGGGGPP